MTFGAQTKFHGQREISKVCSYRTELATKREKGGERKIGYNLGKRVQKWRVQRKKLKLLERCSTSMKALPPLRGSPGRSLQGGARHAENSSRARKNVRTTEKEKRQRSPLARRTVDPGGNYHKTTGTRLLKGGGIPSLKKTSPTAQEERTAGGGASAFRSVSLMDVPKKTKGEKRRQRDQKRAVRGEWRVNGEAIKVHEKIAGP